MRSRAPIVFLDPARRAQRTATVAVCALFNADTIVSFKVKLVTIGGVSNELVGALPKPVGAD